MRFLGLPRACGADDTDREGTACEQRDLNYGATTRHPKSAFRAQQARRRGHWVHPMSTAAPPMIYPIGDRRQTNPIRLSVSRELGRDIDGAWWPRADRITNELPNLVAALTPLLGDITSINVNWSALQRPPECNWPGWEHKRQHIMTVIGTHACANLLIISYATHTALALMVMRCAANLPIDAADRDKPAFLTADSILRITQQQCASGRHQVPVSNPSR
jgi:Family of unknown function (DUF5994)